MVKKKINLVMLYLVMSFMFLIPLNMSFVHAEATPQFADRALRANGVGSGSGYTKESVGSMCGGDIDIDDSLILSVLSLCLPGVIKKAMEYKQMGCELVKCKYDHVMIGKTDVSKCESEYSYKTCNYIVGDIFSILGVDFFREIIKNLLANPLGFIYSAGVIYARYYIATCKGPTCTGTPIRAVAFFLTMNDMLGSIQTLKDMAENAEGLFDLGGADNACDDMEDIKKEMKKILDAQN